MATPAAAAPTAAARFARGARGAGAGAGRFVRFSRALRSCRRLRRRVGGPGVLDGPRRRRWSRLRRRFLIFIRSIFIISARDTRRARFYRRFHFYFYFLAIGIFVK